MMRLKDEIRVLAQNNLRKQPEFLDVVVNNQASKTRTKIQEIPGRPGVFKLKPGSGPLAKAGIKAPTYEEPDYESGEEDDSEEEEEQQRAAARRHRRRRAYRHLLGLDTASLWCIVRIIYLSRDLSCHSFLLLWSQSSFTRHFVKLFSFPCSLPRLQMSNVHSWSFLYVRPAASRLFTFPLLWLQQTPPQNHFIASQSAILVSMFPQLHFNLIDIRVTTFNLFCSCFYVYFS